MAIECLVCNSQLEYLKDVEEMECFFCHKKEYSNTHCINKHYVCDECHTKEIDSIIEICLEEKSNNPIYIVEQLMSQQFCHMHGPEHHVIVGSALLTAYNNAGGNIDLKSSLIEMISRGKRVPGGACGFWGACGSGVSTGMFVAIISNSSPLAIKSYGLSNLMTSIALKQIGTIGGPRCCKRNSYLSIISAVDFVKQYFDIQMEIKNIICSRYSQNNQCIGKKCPFSKTN